MLTVCMIKTVAALTNINMQALVAVISSILLGYTSTG